MTTMTLKTLCRSVWLLALLAAPVLGSAQDSIVVRPATVGPAVQRIATASALSTEQIGTINSVRELPDGRVLVNDGLRRRLVIMDTTLKLVEVVLDSLSEIANTYGTRPGSLISFRGDTTLFVDPASLAVVMIDGNGKIARVRSVWRVQDIPWYSQTSGFYGWPGVDAKGRIVYRMPAQPAPPKVAPPPGVPWIPHQPDSAFVVGVHFDTRKVDTLGVIRIPKQEERVRRTVEGGFSFDMVINPLPATDDWAVLPDGRVAFVRWRDYRIEYVNPDGTVTSSEKLPYEWQRMTDEAERADDRFGADRAAAPGKYLVYHRDDPLGQPVRQRLSGKFQRTRRIHPATRHAQRLETAQRRGLRGQLHVCLRAR